MSPIITVKKDYIKIEPKEVDFGEICEGIAEARNLPELSEKNNMWVLHERTHGRDFEPTNRVTGTSAECVSGCR